jgi:hypothetical protein
MVHKSGFLAENIQAHGYSGATSHSMRTLSNLANLGPNITINLSPDKAPLQKYFM